MLGRANADKIYLSLRCFSMGTKQVAGTLRLDLAQFRELAAFAQFSSDLDKATQAQLNRGRRLVELLKQDQYVPLPVAKQVLSVFAGTNGYIDDIPVEDVRKFEAELFRYVDNTAPGLWQKVATKKTIDDEVKAEFVKLITDFKARFTSGK